MKSFGSGCPRLYPGPPVTVDALELKGSHFLWVQCLLNSTVDEILMVPSHFRGLNLQSPSYRRIRRKRILQIQSINRERKFILETDAAFDAMLCLGESTLAASTIILYIRTLQKFGQLLKILILSFAFVKWQFIK